MALPKSIKDRQHQSFEEHAAGEVSRKVSEQNKLAGEDRNRDAIATYKRATTAVSISTATTTTVASGPGFVNRILVVGGTLGNVTIYNNTAGSGTALLPTVTPVAGGVLLENVPFSIGLTIVTAAATVIVGSVIVD